MPIKIFEKLRTKYTVLKPKKQLAQDSIGPKLPSKLASESPKQERPIKSPTQIKGNDQSQFDPDQFKPKSDQIQFDPVLVRT